MATVFRNAGCPSLAIDGTEDHLHMLFVLSRTKSVADVVEEIKTSSSHWIKRKGQSIVISSGKLDTALFRLVNHKSPQLRITSNVKRNIIVSDHFRMRCVFSWRSTELNTTRSMSGIRTAFQALGFERTSFQARWAWLLQVAPSGQTNVIFLTTSCASSPAMLSAKA